jgi:hypothetical protein
MYDKAWIVLMCLPPSYSMHFSRHFRWYLYDAKIFYQCLSVPCRPGIPVHKT